MKALLNITLASALVLASEAQSATWIETPFWKAPQATNFEIGLKGREKLDSECSIFRKAVFKADGTLTSIAENKDRLERFRKPINPIILELNLRPWEKIEKVIKLPGSPSSKEKLPYYTQTIAKTGLLLQDASEVKVISGENSFVEVSRKQGLEEATVEFIQDRTGKFVLNISGMDVACDLYEGTSQLNLVVPAYVELTDEGARSILDFYNKRLLPELANVVLSKNEMPSHKAVRVGYRAGKVLEEEFPSSTSKETETQLMEVLKSLFNAKTFEPSSKVYKTDKHLYVNFEGSSEGKDVLVKVGF